MRLTLTRKVTLFAAVALGMVAALALVTTLGILSNITASDYLANDAMKRANLSKHFDADLARAVAETQAFMHTHADDDRAEALRALAEAQRHVDEIAVLHQQRAGSETAPHTQNTDLHRHRQALLAEGRQYIEAALLATARSDAAAMAQSLAVLEQFEDEFDTFAAQADNTLGTLVSASVNEVQRLNHIRLVIAPLWWGVFALLSIAIVVRLRRNIVDPIKTLSTAASAVARGDLSQSLPITNKDEIGALQQAFNHMVRSLRDQEHERQRYEHELGRMALYDQLTQLPNRALFTDRLGHALTSAQRRGRRVAVLFLDLDNFKIVNDSLGHTQGDRLLQTVAARIGASVRPDDTVARFGGDEFVVLVDDVASAHDAITIAKRLQQHVHTPVVLDGHELCPEASIGIALSAGTGSTPTDLLRDADTALSRAKQTGNGHCQVFDPSMNAEALARLELEADLRRALEHGEFALHYQPIVALNGGGIVGVEALVRWQHPQRGIIPPNVFIPLAEETGLIVPLGQWVLRTACQQARQWQRVFAARAPQFVSVNISARQFADPQLVQLVARTLRDSSLDGTVLELELTESIVMENGASTLGVLQALKRLGVQLAIDDFGTGYSSLAYLQRFPLDTLKIDRSFTQRLDGNNEDSAIVRAIVSLAHTLNLQVTGEGIETAEQFCHLRRLGCEYGQGYYFAKPQPGNAVTALLAAPAPALHNGTPSIAAST